MRAIVVIVGLLVLAACKPAPRPAIAFLTATPRDQDVASFERRAAERDTPVIALAATDAAQQRAQLDDVLARGAKVIVVEPIGAQAAGYVRLAHERGAKLVAYGRAITSPDLDYYVAHDSYRAGVLEAEAALDATHHRGRYVLLGGGEVARGFENTLAPYVARGDVAIATKRDPASAADAQRAIADAGAIDAVLAASGAPTEGAIAAGLLHVFVAGASGDDGCHGPSALVLEDARLLATTAADIAQHLLDGEAPKADTTIELAGNRIPSAAVRVELVTCTHQLAVAR